MLLTTREKVLLCQLGRHLNFCSSQFSFSTAFCFFNQVLRYSAEFDTSVENDKDRKFIFQYSLADGKISIYETRTPNSGFPPGYFLKSSYVPKFTSSENKQDYFTPADFIIGNLPSNLTFEPTKL